MAQILIDLFRLAAVITIAVLIGLLLAGQARADDWDLAIQINGRSVHKDKLCDHSACNEKNDGLGLEFRNYTNYPTIFAAGRFDNSVNQDAKYIGVGKTARFGDRYGAEVGVFGAYMSYETRLGEDRFFAAAPIVIIDLNVVRINGIYIPPFHVNEFKTDGLWFFQLVVPLHW